MERPSRQQLRRWAIWVAVIAPIALALGGVAYSAAALPGCTSCHTDEPFASATAASPHADVPCASCHVGAGVGDRVAFGVREVFHMVVPIVGGEGRDWAVVTDARCIACHEEIDAGVVTSNGINISHPLCVVDATCSSCHATTAHGEATTWARTYDMETCLECHVSQGLADCDLCHEGKLPADRVTTGVFSVTHGANWKATHGMGNASTCAACHTAAACERCHGVGLPHGPDFIKTHSALAQDVDAQCESCHEPAFCDDCHGLPMPHDQRFTREHSTAAEENEALCKRCHADPDCSECHVLHVHPGGAIGTLGGAQSGGD